MPINKSRVVYELKHAAVKIQVERLTDGSGYVWQVSELMPAKLIGEGTTRTFFDAFRAAVAALDRFKAKTQAQDK
jgi:hypothetical protein